MKQQRNNDPGWDAEERGHAAQRHDGIGSAPSAANPSESSPAIQDGKAT